MGEDNFIGIASLMAAEVMKEDTDAREAAYNLGDQVEVLPLSGLPKLLEVFDIDEFNRPVTVEVECHITRLQLYSLLAGRKITNNWLKLHGRAMVRKPVKHFRKAVAKIG